MAITITPDDKRYFHGLFRVIFSSENDKNTKGVANALSGKVYIPCEFDEIEWCSPLFRSGLIKLYYKGKVALYKIEDIPSFVEKQNVSDEIKEKMRIDEIHLVEKIRKKESEELCCLTKRRFVWSYTNRTNIENYIFHISDMDFEKIENNTQFLYYGRSVAFDIFEDPEKKNPITCFKFKNCDIGLRFFITIHDLVDDIKIKPEIVEYIGPISKKNVEVQVYSADLVGGDFQKLKDGEWSFDEETDPWEDRFCTRRPREGRDFELSPFYENVSIVYGSVKELALREEEVETGTDTFYCPVYERNGSFDKWAKELYAINNCKITAGLNDVIDIILSNCQNITISKRILFNTFRRDYHLQEFYPEKYKCLEHGKFSFVSSHSFSSLSKFYHFINPNINWEDEESTRNWEKRKAALETEYDALETEYAKLCKKEKYRKMCRVKYGSITKPYYVLSFDFPDSIESSNSTEFKCFGEVEKRKLECNFNDIIWMTGDLMDCVDESISYKFGKHCFVGLLRSYSMCNVIDVADFIYNLASSYNLQNDLRIFWATKEELVQVIKNGKNISTGI